MKKTLATLLLAPPTLGFLAMGWSFFGDVKASISRASDNEKKILEIEKKIYDIHWFLIERNNVKVPKRRVNGL